METELKEIRPDTIVDAAEMMKAIANPLRIKILSLLYHKGEMSVTDLQNELETEQSLVSHNLRLMKDRGILLTRKLGKNCYYSLKHKKLYQVIECVSECCGKN
ncbi:MAG: ArsR/SmtB family transcription factor [Rhodothermaceae bacterium]